MPTPLEKRIIQERAQRVKGGLIVPLLTELLKSPLGIDTEDDARWLYELAMKQVERERIRKESYANNEMVFSPSGLADCLRRVYLSKNHQSLGLQRIDLPAVEPHFYFFTGDFLHLKWQFAFYKLSGIHPDFLLVDTEIPILSKRRDHGGTLDVLCLHHLGRNPEALVIDVKGLNSRWFHDIERGNTKHEYRIQVTDYGMLFNSALQGGRWKPPKFAMKWLKERGVKEFPKVKRMVILAENKGGPDLAHPAALTEDIISLKDNLPEVHIRLGELRAYEEEGEIPPPECTSTKGIQFQGCPFAGFCHKEVRRIEKEIARAKISDPARLKVARPSRRSRARRS